MVIVTKSNEGHYGYYLSIIEKHIEDAISVDLNSRSISLLKLILTRRNEKFVILNGDYLIRKRPYIFFLLLLLRIEVVQIFYNIDFLYKNNIRSYFFKLLFKVQKRLFNRIKNLCLVDNSENKKLGLVHVPDPIEMPTTSFADEEVKPFILLFGTHGPRKGTYNFLKKYKGDLEVVVVGKIVDERIHDFKNEEKIKIVAGFVSDEIKHSYFSSAKCVAIPYINWHGSSGVLGHALLYDKVVIGPRGFHIGKVLEEYSKSIFIDIDQDKIIIDRNIIEALIEKSSNSNVIIEKYYSEQRFIEAIK